jgi:hypothetical protein
MWATSQGKLLNGAAPVMPVPIRDALAGPPDPALTSVHPHPFNARVDLTVVAVLANTTKALEAVDGAGRLIAESFLRVFFEKECAPAAP